MRQRPSRAAARPAAPPAPALAVAPSTTVEARPHTKVTLVNFCDDGALQTHPELAPLIDEGWRIKSAVPRLLEMEGPKLLVVLTMPALVANDPAPELPEPTVRPL